MTRFQNGGSTLLYPSPHLYPAPYPPSVINQPLFFCGLYSLHNWLVFFSERAPPLVFVLLAAGPCFSGLVYIEGFVDWEKLVWALIGMLVRVLILKYIPLWVTTLNTD